MSKLFCTPALLLFKLFVNKRHKRHGKRFCHKRALLSFSPPPPAHTGMVHGATTVLISSWLSRPANEEVEHELIMSDAGGRHELPAAATWTAAAGANERRRRCICYYICLYYISCS